MNDKAQIKAFVYPFTTHGIYSKDAENFKNLLSAFTFLTNVLLISKIKKYRYQSRMALILLVGVVSLSFYCIHDYFASNHIETKHLTFDLFANMTTASFIAVISVLTIVYIFIDGSTTLNNGYYFYKSIYKKMQFLTCLRNPYLRHILDVNKEPYQSMLNDLAGILQIASSGEILTNQALYKSIQDLFPETDFEQAFNAIAIEWRDGTYDRDWLLIVKDRPEFDYATTDLECEDTLNYILSSASETLERMSNNNEIILSSVTTQTNNDAAVQNLLTKWINESASYDETLNMYLVELQSNIAHLDNLCQQMIHNYHLNSDDHYRSLMNGIYKKLEILYQKFTEKSISSTRLNTELKQFTEILVHEK